MPNKDEIEALCEQACQLAREIDPLLLGGPDARLSDYQNSDDLAVVDKALQALTTKENAPPDTLKETANSFKLDEAVSRNAESPVGALVERELFAFLCRKYVQRADDRQKSMGLQYTEAETHDLAKEIARFIEALQSQRAENDREGS